MNNDVLLILGNGFDLNLGLKTSYADFIKDTFDTNKECENSLCSHMIKVLNTSELNWIDIENELKKYSKSLPEQCSMTNKQFKEEYQMLCNLLKEYLLKVSDRKKWDSETLNNMRNTEAYKVLSKVIQYPTYFIANFNYTPSVQNLGLNILTDKIIHIHGSLEPDSGIVFGVEETANINNEHVFLHKSRSKYINLNSFNHLLRSSNEIIFFGYSLGETDHYYFSSFLSHVSGKKITFYHYNEDDYENLYKQLTILTGKRCTKLKTNNEIEFISIS